MQPTPSTFPLPTLPARRADPGTVDVPVMKRLLVLGSGVLGLLAALGWATGTIAPWDRQLYPMLGLLLAAALAMLHWRPDQARAVSLLVAVSLNCYLVAGTLLAIFAPARPPSVLTLVTSAFWMPLGYVAAFLFLERRTALALAAGTFTATFLPSVTALALGALTPWGPDLPLLLLDMALAHGVLIVALMAIGRLRHRYAAARERMLAMRALATTDLLTGLPNRRGLMDGLDAQLALAQREETALSVVLLDVDHFKQVNDHHGHDTGDAVLATLAGVLARQIRHGDLAGRWGGEEFLLLAPGAGLDEAWELAERVRRAVAATAFGAAGPVTLSLGVAELQPGDRRETLLRRADVALYRAKSAGRNRVCVSRPDAGGA